MQGYLVLAVDLYDGKKPKNAEQAQEWAAAIQKGAAVEKLRGAVGYLQNWMADPTRVAVIGWGSGATLALYLAEAESNLKAVVVNCGLAPVNQTAMSAIRAPVLANLGELDKSTSAEQVLDFTNLMKLMKKRVDVKVYAAVGHDFEDENDIQSYNAPDAIDASVRTQSFLTAYLKDEKRHSAAK